LLQRLQVRFGAPHCDGVPAASGLYQFDPPALDLAPRASGTVTVSFAPRDARDFPAEVPIFLGQGSLPPSSRPGTSAAAGSRLGSPAGGQRGACGGVSASPAAAPAQHKGGGPALLSPYLQLELQGTGKFAALTFDVRECVLPPVPLGGPLGA
jgi:hypothetical protein